MVSMKLYVMLKNIQTITYEWTSDKLYVEADETFWELCAVGRCARAVVNHVTPIEDDVRLGDVHVLSSTTSAHAD